MDKIKNTSIFLGLLLIIFYGINCYINVLSKNDPIMSKINNKKDKYYKEAVSAKIVGNEMIAGLTGLEIDKDKSYYNMLKYGNFNEALIELKKVEPTISISNYYDKYIVRGNPEKREIALLFLIRDEDILKEVENILVKKEEKGTFFIESSMLDKSIIKNNEFEYELYNDNNEYSYELFESGIDYLNSISKNNGQYCFNRGDNTEFLKICSKLKIHSIKVNIFIDNNLYHQVKSNTMNSIFIGIDTNKAIIRELGVTIDYLKNHGYKLVTLDELLKE